MKGVEDLRTPLATALHIEKNVRGTTAGFNTPTFVIDAPGGGGKRDVHSFEYYDRETGVSVFTSPAVRKGALYLYFDPLSLAVTVSAAQVAGPGRAGGDDQGGDRAGPAPGEAVQRGRSRRRQQTQLNVKEKATAMMQASTSSFEPSPLTNPRPALGAVSSRAPRTQAAMSSALATLQALRDRHAFWDSPLLTACTRGTLSREDFTVHLRAILRLFAQLHPLSRGGDGQLRRRLLPVAAHREPVGGERREGHRAAARADLPPLPARRSGHRHQSDRVPPSDRELRARVSSTSACARTRWHRAPSCRSAPRAS